MQREHLRKVIDQSKPEEEFYFHQWLFDSFYGSIKPVYALVEKADGTMCNIYINLVKFIS